MPQLHGRKGYAALITLIGSPLPDSGIAPQANGIFLSYFKAHAPMETSTLVLIGLLGAALSWMLTLHIKEERQKIQDCLREERNQTERAERMKRLTGKK